ncbi:MAG: hypothetical protein RMJ33_13395, partial [Saprospiraceae bacterium]|nr:hypothetical protein [Saprospiraceae bacterium]
GREEGIERMLLVFMQKNPGWSDEQLSAVFEVSVDTVRKMRRLIGPFECNAFVLEAPSDF